MLLQPKQKQLNKTAFVVKNKKIGSNLEQIWQILIFLKIFDFKPNSQIFQPAQNRIGLVKKILWFLGVFVEFLLYKNIRQTDVVKT